LSAKNTTAKKSHIRTKKSKKVLVLKKIVVPLRPEYK